MKIFSPEKDRHFFARLLHIDQFNDQGTALYKMPYPLADFLPDLNRSKIGIVITELHADTINWVKSHDLANIDYFISGQLNFELDRARVHQSQFWFYSTARHNNDQYVYSSPMKPNYFDILLGRRKPHRDLIYNYVDKVSNIVRYFDPDRGFDPDNFIWEPQVEVQPVDWTAEEVNRSGTRMSLSQVLPISVYQTTCYTLLAETNTDNDYSFFTEKTAKPIIARRPFLVSAGQYHLRNLRSMGFKTFDSVVDESYDIEPDMEIRTRMMLEQYDKLMKSDKDYVLSKTKPIVDHNRQLMLSTDWYTDLKIFLSD